jgi:hypothetical protein
MKLSLAGTVNRLNVRCSFFVNPSYELFSFRQNLLAKLKADFQQDYQNFFGLVWLYPVHPACQGEVPL